MAETLYPMRVVTRMSGLSPDTIRVWERRHGAVTPKRTRGNARRFSATDVRRLQLLKQATDLGHAIRDVARQDEQALRALVSKDGYATVTSPAPAPMGHDRLVTDYLDAVASFDGHRAWRFLSLAASLCDRFDFVFRVVIPLLRETGARWERGAFSVAHEHLVSTHVQGLLLAFVRAAPPQPGAPRMLVTTPAGHRHAFGALAGAYVATARGLDVVYLGPDLPEPDLLVAVRGIGPRIVLLSVIRDVSDTESAALVRLVDRVAEQTQVWVGLPEDHQMVDRLSRARLFHLYEDLDAALTHQARSAT